MILVFKSSARARYTQENLTALGLPPGFRLRTDYAVRWVDSSVAEGTAALPAQALLLFAHGDPPVFHPVRYCTLEQVIRRGEFMGLVLRTGAFVHAGSIEAMTQTLNAALGESGLPPGDGNYVRPLDDALARKLDLKPFTMDDDAGQRLWQTKVEWLRHIDGVYEKALFAYLQGVWDANESRYLPPTDLREFQPGYETGYVVYPEQHYECHLDVMVPDYELIEQARAKPPKMRALASQLQVSLSQADGEYPLPKYGSVKQPSLVFTRPGATRLQLEADRDMKGPVFVIPFKVLGSVPERRAETQDRTEEDFLEIQQRLEDWYNVRETADPQVLTARLEQANFALALVLAEYGRQSNERPFVMHKLHELHGYLKRYETKPDEDRVERIVRLAHGLWRTAEPESYRDLIVRAKDLYPHNVLFSREMAVLEADRPDGKDRARDNLWHVFRHVKAGAYSANLVLLWKLLDRNNQYVWDAFGDIFEKHAEQAARQVVENKAEWASEPRVFLQRGGEVAIDLLGRSTLPDIQRLAIFRAMLSGLARLGEPGPAMELITAALASSPIAEEAARAVADVLLSRSKDGGFPRLLNEIFAKLTAAGSLDLLESLEVFCDSMLSPANEVGLYEALVAHPDLDPARRASVRLKLYDRVRATDAGREESLYHEVIEGLLGDEDFAAAAQFATSSAGPKPERYSDLAGILLLAGEVQGAAEAFRHAMEVHRARGERVKAAEALRAMLLLAPEDADRLAADLVAIERAMSAPEKLAAAEAASALEGAANFVRPWRLLVIGAGSQMKTWATPRLEAMGAQVDWFTVERNKGIHTGHLEGRIRGGADGVLLVTAFLGHAVAAIIHEACRLNQVAYLDVGLRGVSRILALAKTELEPKMLAVAQAAETPEPAPTRRKAKKK